MIMLVILMSAVREDQHMQPILLKPALAAFES